MRVEGVRTRPGAHFARWPHLLISIFLATAPLQLSAAGKSSALKDLFQGDSSGTQEYTFQHRAYCGHSLGRSFLDPEPRQSDVLAVGNSDDSGYNAVIGYDINRWLSAEVNLADLGSATIDRVDPGNERTSIDQISYQVLDLSAVAYLFNLRSGFANELNTRGLFCRQSLSLYSRLGYGIMRNDAELNRVDHGRVFESHVTVGVGLEYGFDNGLAVRGDYIRFDTDARYVGIGLIARFGDNGCTGAPVVASLPSVSLVPLIDEIGTGDQLSIDPVVQFDNYFDVDMDSLSAETREELARFADEIRDTEQQVYIAGHADWIGDSDYNLALSERRVGAVRAFLESQGIDVSRIEFEGFGEDKPTDSNETASGRAKNRRVEIRLR